MDETQKTLGDKAKEFGKKYGRRIVTVGVVIGAFALGAYLQQKRDEETEALYELGHADGVEETLELETNE